MWAIYALIVLTGAAFALALIRSIVDGQASPVAVAALALVGMGMSVAVASATAVAGLVESAPARWGGLPFLLAGVALLSMQWVGPTTTRLYAFAACVLVLEGLGHASDALD